MLKKNAYFFIVLPCYIYLFKNSSIKLNKMSLKSGYAGNLGDELQSDHRRVDVTSSRRDHDIPDTARL